MQPPVLANDEERIKVVVAPDPAIISPTIPSSWDGLVLATPSDVAIPLSTVRVPSVSMLPFEAVVVAKPLMRRLADVLEA